MLRARMLFLYISILPLIAGANGSSTVGTVIVKGLSADSTDTHIEVIDNEIFEVPEVSLAHFEVLESAIGFNKQLLLSFFVLNKEQFNEVVMRLDKKTVGQMAGHHGWFNGLEVWVVTTAKGRRVLLQRESSDTRATYNVISALRH